jgi:hypothetical protein
MDRFDLRTKHQANSIRGAAGRKQKSRRSHRNDG